MNDDYLWNRSGTPDPEIERLERVLGSLRYDRPVPVFPPPAVRSFRSGNRVWAIVRQPAFYACTAGFVLILAAAAIWHNFSRPAYQVVGLRGNPAVDSRSFGTTGLLRVGQWLETDSSSRARIRVGAIGEVDVEPNTRIGLVRARATEHRLSLQRGVMHALIWAPPRLFFVETPSAEAIDLGCAYTLEVDDRGWGTLKVTAGWVAFERDGRESFVPGGAECMTRPGVGPGTPFMEEAAPSFKEALEQLDFGAGNSVDRPAAFTALLAGARTEDGLTLWHLLSRLGATERPLVYERLAALVPPPRGVTRTGVLGGNKRMLDLWWGELGLGSADWWRLWKGPSPEPR